MAKEKKSVLPEGITEARKPISPGYVALVAIISFIAILYMLPLLWMILTSLKTFKEVSTVPIKFFPESLQWINYKEVFDVIPLANSYLNSVIVSVSVTFGAVLTSTMGGYSFAKLEYPGRDKIFTGVVATTMVPSFLMAIPLYSIFRAFGILNTHLGLILPGCVSAFGVFLMRQNIMSIPTELIHAARIDGCGEVRIFVQMIVPLARGGIATLVIFTFMGAWDDFFWPLLIATKAEMWTLPLVIRQLVSQDGSWYHWQMAAATLAILPIVCIFLFFQKYIIQSVAVSGMKL